MANPQILASIKQMLGLGADYHAFDEELIVHINAAFFWLDQLGVGPGIVVLDETTLWTDIDQPKSTIEALKSAVWLKTRLLFDPPNSGFVTNSMTETLKELAWRLQVEGDRQALQTATPQDPS